MYIVSFIFLAVSYILCFNSLNLALLLFTAQRLQDSMSEKKSGKVHIRCMGGEEDVSLRQTYFNAMLLPLSKLFISIYHIQ